MVQDSDLVAGDDRRKRCWWCGSDPGYVRYHDEEWGMPVNDDRRFFFSAMHRSYDIAEKFSRPSTTRPDPRP